MRPHTPVYEIPFNNSINFNRKQTYEKKLVKRFP